MLFSKVNFYKTKKRTYTIYKRASYNLMNNNTFWSIDTNQEEYLHDNDLVGDFDFDEPINCLDLTATGERFPCDNCTCGFDKETVTNYVSKCG